jgi:L-rhamnonate dehydratase
LIGQDPSLVEQLWQRLYRATLPYGQKGLALMAISGVDLALWDLRGKRAGKPLVEILGGQAGQPIPCYKTGWSPEEVATGHAQGFRAVKLQVGTLDAAGAIAQVRRVRQILGPEGRVMTDAFMSWDIETALQAAAGFAEHNVGWLEEPLPIDDMAGYERLQRESRIPIAGGEHEYTAAAFAMWMERKLHTVVQPDVCWCGGLTELVKIYQMARQFGVKVCPHRGAEVWALHAIAALDTDPLAESGRPWITWVEGQPAIHEGTIRLGTAPGFGVQFDEDLFAVRSTSYNAQ